MNEAQESQLDQMDPQFENRSTSIRQIESSLADISSLFKKFGTIVAQHETLVTRID